MKAGYAPNTFVIACLRAFCRLYFRLPHRFFLWNIIVLSTIDIGSGLLIGSEILL